MDELQLVRAIRETRPVPAAARNAAAQRLAAVSSGRATPSRPSLPRFALPAAVAGAAALAVVAALLTGITERNVQPSSAQAALNEAANHARNDATLTLGPNEAFYVKSRTGFREWGPVVHGKPTHVTTNVHGSETWTQRDGTATVRIPTPERPRANQVIQLHRAGNGFPTTSPTVDDTPTITYDEIVALPTNGDAMYRALVQVAVKRPDSPELTDQWIFQFVADVLTNVPLPAATRSALYGALSHANGIKAAGTVQVNGVDGTAVELAGGGQTNMQLVFDPETTKALRFSLSVAQPPAGKRSKYPFAVGKTLFERQVLQQEVVPNAAIPPLTRRNAHSGV
jgi:hypothetical protein